jgi:translation initiation factor eIF-2B subunit delta
MTDAPHSLTHVQDVPRLGLLNLKYDAMPAEYVTAIVTEHAMIPPTSVPVIIREYQQYVREQ